MALTREQVLHIAKLARVGMTETDIEVMREQLSHSREQWAARRQIKTDDVPPTGHGFAVQNVMRPDEVQPSYPLEEVLANAPAREDDFFRVRAVLE